MMMWLTLFSPTGGGVAVALGVVVLLEVPCAVGVAVGVAPLLRVGVGRGALACLMVEELEPLHPPKARMKRSTASRPILRSEVRFGVISEFLRWEMLMVRRSVVYLCCVFLGWTLYTSEPKAFSPFW